MFPLKRRESFALWESIRYRLQMNEIRSLARFPIDISEDWFASKFCGKVFKDSNALEYGKELIALIVFNQETFLARKPYRFRGTCEDLGWKLSAAFCEYLFMVLFVICAEPSKVKQISKAVEKAQKGWKKTWGNSGVQKAVKKAFKEAAIEAEKQNKIKYKQTFNLLKTIFPTALK